MKKIFVALLLLTGFYGFGQSIGRLRYDSVIIEKVGGTAELIIRNSTKDTLGFLYNFGNGRTGFKTIPASSGSGGLTGARNLGSSFRIFLPDSSGWKTLANGYAIGIDSATAKTLTFKADTSLLQKLLSYGNTIVKNNNTLYLKNDTTSCDTCLVGYRAGRFGTYPSAYIDTTGGAIGYVPVYKGGRTYKLQSVSATPGGSTTQLQFNDASAFNGDANLTWDKTNKELLITGTTTNTNLRIGTLAMQGFGLNNTWICDNCYYNSGYKARATGYSPMIYFANGGIDFLVSSATATAGSAANQTVRFRIQGDGKIAVGANFTPTAYLHLPNGSTAASTAPLKFITGSLMSTPEAGAMEYLTPYWYGTDGGATRGIFKRTVINVSNGASATLGGGVTYYVFSGTTTTWTLPSISGLVVGTEFNIKNRGSGSITLNSNAGGNDIYTSSAVNTTTITAGSTLKLIYDGTYFSTF